MKIDNFSHLNCNNKVEVEKEAVFSKINNKAEISQNEKIQKLPLVTAQYALNNHLVIKNPSFCGKTLAEEEVEQLTNKYKQNGEDFADLKAFIEYKKHFDEEFAHLPEDKRLISLQPRFNISTMNSIDNIKACIFQSTCAKISDTLLMKYICVDKLTKTEDISKAYSNYLKSIADKTNLFNGNDVNFVNRNIHVCACLDENGLPDEKKLETIKKLYTLYPDITKYEYRWSNYDPFRSPAIKILENSKSNIEKINDVILSQLENLDIKFFKNLPNEIEKLLNSKNPEFDLKVINFVRNVQNEECFESNDETNLLLYKIHNEKMLDLYSSLYNSSDLSIKNIQELVYSDLEKEDAINLAKIFNNVSNDEDVWGRENVINFSDYIHLYEKICENNDEDEKADFLNKIKSLKDKRFTNDAIVMLLSIDKNQYNQFENKMLKNYNKFFTKEPDYRLQIDKYLTDKYLKLSDREVDIICDTVSYFTKNIDKLQQHGEEISAAEIAYGLNLSHENIIEIVNMFDQDVMNNAIELKAHGLVTLINNVKNLKNLDDDTKELLKEKLNQLSHPRQKLDTLSTVSSLIGEIDNNVLFDIISNIKSPKITEEQKELANDIFADKNTDYSKQIEEFITKFNVPDEKQDIIRKFLKKSDLQNKYRTPQSYEKQMQIIETKINAIIRNEKIPQEKKDICLNVLNEQKQELIKNPNKYTKPRIDDNSMKNLAAQVEAHINTPNNDKKFNNLLKTQLYKILNIETDNNLLNNIKYDNQYFSCIFTGLEEDGFKDNFIKLIEFIKNNPNKKLSEILDTIDSNKETHRLFDEKGLDYNRWINFDENSKLDFTLQVNVEKSLQAAKKNLIKELTSDLAQKLDKNEVEKLINITNDMNIEKANQKELPKIIKAIEEHIQNNEYWKNNSNQNIAEFKDHIKIHKKNIRDLETLKNSTEELSVRLWDKNDIGRNLFFGNHVCCCTSIGSFNSFAAPQHLMNSFVNGIELVDKKGNSMGNSMCYFADVDDKLTFVIDSFEANGKLGASKEVTNAIINYAKQVCEEMGRPDAQIMFGPNYNKLNFDRCNLTASHTIDVIGRTDEETYIDALGGHTIINEPVYNCSMYEIK